MRISDWSSDVCSSDLYAHCCHPLPGDRIVGIVTTGKGVTVHTIDCDTLESFQATPERWVDLSWDVDEGPDQRIGRLHVVVADEPGSLGSLPPLNGKKDRESAGLGKRSEVRVEPGGVRGL